MESNKNTFFFDLRFKIFKIGADYIGVCISISLLFIVLEINQIGFSSITKVQAIFILFILNPIRDFFSAIAHILFLPIYRKVTRRKYLSKLTRCFEKIEGEKDIEYELLLSYISFMDFSSLFNDDNEKNSLKNMLKSKIEKNWKKKIQKSLSKRKREYFRNSK